MPTFTADAVVVGAGLAGAATGWELSRRGLGRVLVLEQEPVPGMHSSGRNAGIVRQSGLPPAIAPLAREGARLITHPPGDLDPPADVNACGTLLLARGAEATRLRAEALAAHEHGLSSVWLEPDEIVRRVPLCEDGRFEGGLLCPEDGVVDPSALLAAVCHAARARGVAIVERRRAIAVRVSRGRVAGVEIDWDFISTPLVVNAAGAWAAEVGARAGASPVPLVPHRRHLFVSGQHPHIDPWWPVVWDVTEGLYFRPERPGLLLSACDETPHPAREPHVDPAAAELLATKARRALPRLADLTIARSWASLRTLTPDRLFALGPDPRVAGFYWCAGLGGHGVTTCLAVARVVADCVLGAPAPADHDPARFEADARTPLAAAAAALAGRLERNR